MGLRVFAVAAHPDDVEFVMAGTMLRLAGHGAELHLMTLADGRCGSMFADADATARIRADEQRAAAAVLGAACHPPICEDLGVLYDRPTLARLAAVVRRVAPDVMLVHSPGDYMEDHTESCRLAVTAAFARGMPNFVTDPPTPPVEGPVVLYHAQPHGNRDGLGREVRPDIYIDVGPVLDRKSQALACHASQRDWLDRTQGMGSYVQSMKDGCAEVGRWSGRFAYAEGWRRHSHLGFCPAGADPIGELPDA